MIGRGHQGPFFSYVLTPFFVLGTNNSGRCAWGPRVARMGSPFSTTAVFSQAVTWCGFGPGPVYGPRAAGVLLRVLGIADVVPADDADAVARGLGAAWFIRRLYLCLDLREKGL